MTSPDIAIEVEGLTKSFGDRVVVLTSRPGRVAVEVPVELPRPRRLESPAVASLAGEITEHLRAEVRRHG